MVATSPKSPTQTLRESLGLKFWLFSISLNDDDAMQRIADITSYLQSSLEGELVKGIGSGATPHIHRCLNSYALIGKTRDAENLVRAHVAKPFMDEVSDCFIDAYYVMEPNIRSIDRCRAFYVLRVSFAVAFALSEAKFLLRQFKDWRLLRSREVEGSIRDADRSW